MQQPMNTNPVQVVVVTQPVMIDKQIQYRNMKTNLARQLISLGITQLVIGILCIIFQCVAVGIFADNFSSQSTGNDFHVPGIDYLGHGFWTGLLFLITGPFGISGGMKRSRCQVVAFNVLSILSASFAACLLSIAIPGAIDYAYGTQRCDYVSSGTTSRYNSYSYYYNCYSSGTVLDQTGLAMEALMAILALIEVIIAIWSAAVCCKIGACCCNCGGSCCCPPASLQNQLEMQQPASMNGTPVIVSVETAPIQTRRRYIPVTSEPARQFKILGVAHIVIGALCITFQIVSFGCMPDIAAISGNAIWIGTLFIVTGVFGVFAGRTGRKCQVITFHVLSTISAGFAFILLCVAVTSAGLASPYTQHYIYDPSSMAQSIVATVLGALIAMLAIAGGVIAIRSSVIGCTIGACCNCCCKCRERCGCCACCACCPTDSQYQQFHNSDELDLTQQQSFASSQQEPTFNTNQEPSMLNQHQQQLMFNPGQKQLALNPNHQPPVFNPSQQQTIFNPNQQQPIFNPNRQQPIFNPNQQQPIFNPNQQQPMFNPNQQQPIFNANQQQQIFNPNQPQITLHPTQPNVGFYPQHQAVQYYALQPIIVAGSHQTDVSTIISEATGQRQDTGPRTELKASPLSGDNTGTSGSNGYDKGHISSDDAEMLSP